MILQLYMNLTILVSQANLLKNWVLCITKMLHNICFLQSFYSDSAMNLIFKGLKREEGQTFAKNVQILITSEHASNIRFPTVQEQFIAAF